MDNPIIILILAAIAWTLYLMVEKANKLASDPRFDPSSDQFLGSEVPNPFTYTGATSYFPADAFTGQPSSGVTLDVPYG